MSSRQADHYADQGIAAVQGSARITPRDKLDVSDRTLTARDIALASGVVPLPLGIPGAQHVVTSDDFMDLEALPGRIALIGGGYIALGLFHLAARPGRGPNGRFGATHVRKRMLASPGVLPATDP